MNIFHSAFCLIIYDHKLLLMLRDDKPDLPAANTWSVIGGRREGNETPEQTVIRETKEETNISLTTIQFLQSTNSEGRTSEAFVSYITKEQFESIKLGDEGQKLEFFSYEQLSTIPLAPTLAKLLTQYSQTLQKLLSAHGKL